VTFMGLPLPTLGRRGGRRRRHPPAPAAGRIRLPQQPPCWWGLQQDGFLGAVAVGARTLGRRPGRVFLGTSTSGLLQTELAYRRRTSDGSLPADFHYGPTQTPTRSRISRCTHCSCKAPSWVVSTACSSSAKVFGTAARMIAAGLVDAAVVGGVDSLCLSTLYGFNSLELLSDEICRPWDAARKGLSIGEAAAFALVERASEAPQGWLLGIGETNDGYHMSTPHPEGAARSRRCAAHSPMQACRRPTSTTSTCTAPPRPPTTWPKMRRSTAFSAAARLAVRPKGATGHTLGQPAL